MPVSPGPGRTVRCIDSQIVVSFTDINISTAIRKQTPIKSELVIAVLLGLHTNNNKDVETLLNKEQIVSLLLERKMVFKAFEKGNSLTREHYTKDPVHERGDLIDFEAQRKDFERLCSNHTTEQYQNHCENIKAYLMQHRPSYLHDDILTFPKSSKHTEVSHR